MIQENKEIKLQQSTIPEFSSGSSTHAVAHGTAKRQALKTLKQVQGLSCFSATHAFTLIELLVVVLIISILAAVALPQYQKAVMRAKTRQGLIILESIIQSFHRYYLENGEYPTNFSQIDIGLPGNWTGSQAFYSSSTIDVKSNGDWSVVLESSRSGYPGIYVGMLNGKYKGAGFGYFRSQPIDGHLKPHTIYCLEGSRHGIFKGTPGDFCQRILNGEIVHTGGYRLYQMFNI